MQILPHSSRQAHRKRIERLLAGDIREEDLIHVYLGLRSFARNSPSVEEIGHFIAHRDQRRAGLVTEAARDYIRIARFNMSPAMLQNAPYLHPAFPEITLLNLARMAPDMVKAVTGRPKREARRIAQKALDRFLQQPDGSWLTNAAITHQEEAVLKGAAGTLALRPPFGSEMLVHDLSRALVLNQVMSTSSLRGLANRENALALFAMSMMHGTTLEFDDGSVATLSLQAGWNGGLDIGATGVLMNDRQINFVMFSSSIDPRKHCDESVRLDPVADPNRLIELTSDLRLTYTA